MMKEIIIDLWKVFPMWTKLCIGTILLCLAACAIGCGVYKWSSYPQDNIVEEIAEEVLEHYTGIDIDVTPATPEK